MSSGDPFATATATPPPHPLTKDADPFAKASSAPVGDDPFASRRRRQASVYDRLIPASGSLSYGSGEDAELARAQPQTQSLAKALGSYIPGMSTVTSVLSGPHRGSAHGEGRAIDLAPGFQIGDNPQTLQAVANLIMSGKIEALGTELSVVSNPQLKALAANHNVDLFEDDVHTHATGPHFHIQVPSEGSAEARFRAQSAIYREPQQSYGQEPFSPRSKGDPFKGGAGNPKVVKRTKLNSATSPDPFDEAAQRKLKTLYADPNYEALATGGKPPDAPQLPQFATTALSEIAGHQDLPFILMAAADRDSAMGSGSKPIIQLLRDPKSITSQAWTLYKQDPAKAMDEFGMGSPAQNAWMAQHATGAEKKYYDFLSKHPKSNAALTMLAETFNPMSWAEGLGAGKIFSGLEHLLGAKNVLRAGQAAGRASGMASPLAGLAVRGGDEASNFGKSLIANIAAPHKLLHLGSTDKMFQTIFGGLNPEEQEAVVSLYHGEKLSPKFMNQGGDLARRAALLKSDIEKVTGHQVRVGKLTPDQVHPRYFPMSRSYDFGEGYNLERELSGGLGSPGAANTATKQKVFQTMGQARASGQLSDTFLPANNYVNWRESRLQQVAFEDAMARAPKSLRKDIEASDYKNSSGTRLEKPWVRNAWQTPHDALDQTIAENHARYPQGHPERFELPESSPEYVAVKRVRADLSSPVVRRSMMAPEMLKFITSDQGLRRFLGGGGVHLGGEGNWFGAKFLTMARNFIVSNPFYHSTLNVAPREAAARGLHNIGGPTWEVGGAAYNMARSLAQQAGVDPGKFVGGAKQYADWLDRALVEGAAEELGTPTKSAFGGERARVLSVPPKTWKQKLDRWFTKMGDANRDRTFGSRGAESFAVSLFKDAVQKGKMSEAKAARITSEAIGDLYNFDPKSPLSSFLFFMPWRKGNWKFWTNVLVRKPQYVTAPAHALRNYEEQVSPDAMTGPFGHPDFSLPGQAWSIPFVGRDVGHIANMAGSVAQGVQGKAGPMDAVNEGVTLATGSANPFMRLGENILSTRDASFNKNVEGPETGNFNLIVNTKAPPSVQYKQLAQYFAGHFPVPLVGFSLQRASQRGVSPQDAFAAVLSAVGLGFQGSSHLDDDQRRELSKAEARYKKAYDRFAYEDHDVKSLNQAWEDYYNDLKSLGVVH